VTRTILPGATIGILGGGQLGRMTALAARSMGYSVHVLDPDPTCPAGPVADRCITAAFTDAEAGEELARHCDVVTLEIEQIGVEGLQLAGRHAPVRPGPQVIRVIQDRAEQKRWLRAGGFPVGDYSDVASQQELATALATHGPLYVKANRGGYDGRGQVRVSTAAEVADAWSALGGRPAVAEQGLALELELSVMVARSPRGEVRSYPPARNHHERQVLDWSVLPAGLDPRVASQAEEIARGIAEAFALEGLLCIELFLLQDGRLLVNELAPRPHNSYHQSQQACATSQFEQHVRAVCNLPLGDTTILRPAAIVNLFGDLWSAGVPDFARALELPGVGLHLYGKRVAKPGRKMGHISATGVTATEALALARQAAESIVHPHQAGTT
jgi:5-(carboxyamino)imidazole ribonucleotide synthase